MCQFHLLFSPTRSHSHLFIFALICAITRDLPCSLCTSHKMWAGTRTRADFHTSRVNTASVFLFLLLSCCLYRTNKFMTEINANYRKQKAWLRESPRRSNFLCCFLLQLIISLDTWRFINARLIQLNNLCILR